MNIYAETMINLLKNIVNTIISSIDIKLLILSMVCFYCSGLVNNIDTTLSKKKELIKIFSSLICSGLFLYTQYLLFIGLPIELRQVIVSILIFFTIITLAAGIYLWAIKL